VATGVVETLELVDDGLGEGARGARSAMGWAQAEALAGDGVSRTQIAERLGLNRRTVRRPPAAAEPPRY
jgi:hypothetical protein